MRYLLVGNGPAPDISALAAKSDYVIQINGCRHAEQIPPHLTRYVFLVNTGIEAATRAATELYEKRALLPNARIVLARNPAFYLMKKWALRAKGNWHWRDCDLCHAWKKLRGIWPIEVYPFLHTLNLDLELTTHGMQGSMQPSTGLLAYEWITSRLTPMDRLDIAGFTFEGWDGHPWEIERRVVVPVYPDMSGEGY
jgi:hypothetical protein